MFFTALIHTDTDGIGFTIPDLPGFAAHFEINDMDAAVREAEAVLRDYLAAMIDRGDAIPERRPVKAVIAGLDHNDAQLPVLMLRGYMPAGRPMRVNLSMDETALARIDDKARRRGLTRSAFIVAAADAMD